MATATGNWQPAPAHTCIISCSARYVAHSLFALNAVRFFAIMAISFSCFLAVKCVRSRLQLCKAADLYADYLQSNSASTLMRLAASSLPTCNASGAHTYVGTHPHKYIYTEHTRLTAHIEADGEHTKAHETECQTQGSRSSLSFRQPVVRGSARRG